MVVKWLNKDDAEEVDRIGGDAFERADADEGAAAGAGVHNRAKLSMCRGGPR